jgi:hypothetical protein
MVEGTDSETMEYKRVHHVPVYTTINGIRSVEARKTDARGL